MSKTNVITIAVMANGCSLSDVLDNTNILPESICIFDQNVYENINSIGESVLKIFIQLQADYPGYWSCSLRSENDVTSFRKNNLLEILKEYSTLSRRLDSHISIFTLQKNVDVDKLLLVIRNKLYQNASV